MTTGSLRALPEQCWILSSTRDLVLFIATPLLIVPLVATVQLRLSILEIATVVAAFGALGHHVPGMMRAYGNRELFDRYRARFLLAPIFFVSVSLFFEFRDLHGLMLIIMLWGAWHGLAQVYGFCRIYDAKLGRQSVSVAHLDRWMCITWFVGGVLHSPNRIAVILDTFYQIGGPAAPLGSVVAFREFWDVGTALVTLVFLVNLFWQRANGTPPSAQKLLVMGSAIAFWWYSLVWIESTILGIALFEIFHDVQYVAISWVYNRRIVEKGHRVGAFTRYLFRPRGTLLGLYVGLVFVYGFSQILTNELEASKLRSGVQSVLVASALLHFYIDGFIWKVRERTIRSGLDATGGASNPTRAPLHALLLALFCLPLLVSAASELGEHELTLDHRRSLVGILPNDANVRLGFAEVLDRAGHLEEASVQYLEALTLRPDDAKAQILLGHLYLKEEKWEAASSAFSSALDLDPRNSKAHHSLGQAYQMQGREGLAEREYRRAIALDPTLAKPYNSLGVLLHKRGDLEAARRRYRRALEIDPALDGAHTNLEILLRQEADPGIEHLLEIDSRLVN